MRLRWYDLRYSGSSSTLEGAFRSAYADQSVAHVRLALLLGCLLVAAFGWLDHLLFPEDKYLAWFIRFGVIIPSALVTIGLTWTSFFQKWMQPLLLFTLLVSGVGITVMTILVPAPGSYLYYAGNVLVIFFGYTFLRLRFTWATLGGWILVAAYLAAALGLSETPTEVLISNSFFFISANLLGMVAAYAMEYYSRRDFFLVQALTEETMQVQEARDELEERVEERTRELSQINSALAAEVERREELQGQLAQAQRLEAVGSLAAGVAHDLNNILSGLVGWPDVLLMDLEPESPLAGTVRTIQKSGEEAAAMVQDLLTLARRGVQVKEGVNLSDLVRAQLNSPALGRYTETHPHVKVQAFLAPDLLPVVGSSVHLGKVVANLISNALEANLVDGGVTVATENRYLDVPFQGYEVVPIGEYAVLTVSDTGVGISEQDLSEIFEPFYTKKRMGRSGTGLGMTVVWTAVKDNEGFLDIRSREGSGTTIKVFLPISRGEMVTLPPRFTFEDFKGTEHILVVDDLETQREIAARMLEKLGYRVTKAESGEAAVTWMGANQADLIILDMVMDPGIDGCETYRRILEGHGPQKAIIASGYAENERVRELQELGAGTYVKKPFTLERLAMAVRGELDR